MALALPKIRSTPSSPYRKGLNLLYNIITDTPYPEFESPPKQRNSRQIIPQIDIKLETNTFDHPLYNRSFSSASPKFRKYGRTFLNDQHKFRQSVEPKKQNSRRNLKPVMISFERKRTIRKSPKSRSPERSEFTIKKSTSLRPDRKLQIHDADRLKLRRFYELHNLRKYNSQFGKMNKIQLLKFERKPLPQGVPKQRLGPERSLRQSTVKPHTTDLREDFDLIRNDIYQEEAGCQAEEVEFIPEESKWIREAKLDKMYQHMKFDEVKTVSKSDYANPIDQMMAQMMLNPPPAQSFSTKQNDSSPTHSEKSKSKEWDYKNTTEYKLKLKKKALTKMNSKSKALEDKVNHLNSMIDLVSENTKRGKQIIEIEKQIQSKSILAATSEDDLDQILTANRSVIGDADHALYKLY